MLNRIITFLAFFFAIVAVILGFMYKVQSNTINTLETAKTALEANNQLLISKLEREHNDKVELGRKVKELEEVANNDTDFDWHRDISNSAVVKFLRENANKIR